MRQTKKGESEPRGSVVGTQHRPELPLQSLWNNLSYRHSTSTRQAFKARSRSNRGTAISRKTGEVLGPRLQETVACSYTTIDRHALGLSTIGCVRRAVLPVEAWRFDLKDGDLRRQSRFGYASPAFAHHIDQLAAAQLNDALGLNTGLGAVALAASHRMQRATLQTWMFAGSFPVC